MVRLRSNLSLRSAANNNDGGCARSQGAGSHERPEDEAGVRAGVGQGSATGVVTGGARVGQSCNDLHVHRTNYDAGSVAGGGDGISAGRIKGQRDCDLAFCICSSGERLRCLKNRDLGRNRSPASVSRSGSGELNTDGYSFTGQKTLSTENEFFARNDGGVTNAR